MNRCALCGRKISNGEFNFGLGCLKQIKNVKNLKGEYLLNNKIQRVCNRKKLPKLQSQMLTDRYLTLTLLNEVPLKEYDKYRQSIQNDINTRFAEYPKEKFVVAIAHTDNYEAALEFRKEIAEQLAGIVREEDIEIDNLSLSVSCHIGPGSLAATCTIKE